jgi:hypothetical protein
MKIWLCSLCRQEDVDTLLKLSFTQNLTSKVKKNNFKVGRLIMPKNSITATLKQ